MAKVVSTKIICRLWSCGRGQLSTSSLQPFGNAGQTYKSGFVWKMSGRHCSSNPQSSRKLKLKLRWLMLPAVIGIGYYGYREMVQLKDHVAKQWQVKMYTLLPMNLVSRMWGAMHSVYLPVWMRTPVYKLYIRTFKVNMEESDVEDLKHFKNLGEFFKRRLKSTSRPIDETHDLISPCDGKILHFGRVEEGFVEQVKGVKYSLSGFLGPSNWPTAHNGNREVTSQGHAETHQLSEADYEQSVKTRSDRCLYHCVIYLAPGDYHGFHSPADWLVSMRRHFPGKLLSVNPRIAKKVLGLFNLNERAVYVGQWRDGLLAMAAVGATNVGSIKVYFDQNLKTNTKKRQGVFHDQVFTSSDQEGVRLKKGESFGEFNLGSTIVLIFEAPRTFTFKIDNEQIIKLGQPIGCHKS